MLCYCFELYYEFFAQAEGPNLGSFDFRKFSLSTSAPWTNRLLRPPNDAYLSLVLRNRGNISGGIDEGSRAWKPTPSMDISDTEKVKRDVDFFMMSYEQRAVDLDRLDAPVGHVVTGLKLRLLGGHLNLEIQVIILFRL